MNNELMIPGSGRAVVVAVALAFGLTPDQLTGRCRQRHISRARQAAMWLLRRQALPSGKPGVPRPRSYPEIGALLGGIDHSSAIHGFHKCAAVMAADPDYRARVLRVEAGLPPLPDPIDLGPALRSRPKLPRTVADLPARPVKPKNELADDDPGAVNRYNGSRALLAAIRRYQRERVAA